MLAWVTDWGNADSILNHVNNVSGPPAITKFHYFAENAAQSLFTLMKAFDGLFRAAGEKYASPVGASFPLAITDYYGVTHYGNR